VVEWWGHRANMAKVFAESNIVCLPSYGEGFPKVLVEAASCARALVATDTPGCRDIVRHGKNGLLVPVRDSAALAAAVITLLHDPPLRAKMGACGREIALREFSERMIIRQIFYLYRELLPDRWPEGWVSNSPQPENSSEAVTFPWYDAAISKRLGLADDKVT